MIDVNKWPYFEAVDYAMEFGCSRYYKLWYRFQEKNLSLGISVLSVDNHAMDLANYALEIDDKVVKLHIEEGVVVEAMEIDGGNQYKGFN